MVLGVSGSPMCFTQATTEVLRVDSRQSTFARTPPHRSYTHRSVCPGQAHSCGLCEAHRAATRMVRLRSCAPTAIVRVS